MMSSTTSTRMPAMPPPSVLEIILPQHFLLTAKFDLENYFFPSLPLPIYNYILGKSFTKKHFIRLLKNRSKNNVKNNGCENNLLMADKIHQIIILILIPISNVFFFFLFFFYSSRQTPS